MKQLVTFVASTIVILIIILETDTIEARVSTNVNVSPEEDFYSYFMREAPNHPGIYVKNITMDEIPWLDKQLMERGARFFRKNVFTISMSYLYSLFQAMAFKTTTAVVISTGHFGNSTMAYKRLMKTLYHIQRMCAGGLEVFIPGTEAFESRKIITRRHRSASYMTKDSRSINDLEKMVPVLSTKDSVDLVSAIQSDLAHVDTRNSPIHLYTWDTATSIGQFDLGVSQFLYIRHVTMSPEYLGIYPESVDDLIAFVHLWAVIGRLIGLEDRFNVALNLPPHMYQKFYDNTIVASLQILDERILTLMNNTMNGYKENLSSLPVPRLQCVLYYFFTQTIENFVGINLLTLMDLEDKLCQLMFAFATGPLNRLDIYNSFVTSFFQNWFLNEFVRLKVSV